MGGSACRLLVDEHIEPDGGIASTFIEVADGRLSVTQSHGFRGDLPVDALFVAMKRYGRPVASSVGQRGDQLSVDESTVVYRMRYRSPVDASARDYLVMATTGNEPVAALSTHIAGALTHLARAYSARN